MKATFNTFNITILHKTESSEAFTFHTSTTSYTTTNKLLQISTANTSK